MPARYSCRDDADPAPLTQFLTFSSSTPVASNRLLKAALAERACAWDVSDVSERLVHTNELINLYCNRGKGGWGIICSGSTPIGPAHLEAAGDPIISLNHNPEDGNERFEA
ncbi:NADH:flavin oxidoreductase/NADH oxidase [Colletotrichum sojae]|uniref:NADH:flavin oxidoreductase/NADH oxidase n=1 Tax=Colletotrichum sojae TaxID=2175907 RepID=A0A8H6JYF0_9PEZI|nr:NADH:flavin oxidoreductase/NADH oxidase [Colletotrichum sojae]